MAGVDEITPTVSQVGSLISARTVDVAGAEQGTFTANTRPTAVQAEALAQAAARDVFLALGVEMLDDALVDDALQVAALRAAQLIELSFYPESEPTVAATLAAAYLADVAALQERLHWTAVRLT